MMPMCACLPGTCDRESGVLLAKTRAVFCRSRLVVPRHEPTLPKPMYGKMEPIADEI